MIMDKSEIASQIEAELFKACVNYRAFVKPLKKITRKKRSLRDIRTRNQWNKVYQGMVQSNLIVGYQIIKCKNGKLKVNVAINPVPAYINVTGVVLNPLENEQ